MSKGRSIVTLRKDERSKTDLGVERRYVDMLHASQFSFMKATDHVVSVLLGELETFRLRQVARRNFASNHMIGPVSNFFSVDSLQND